MNCEAVFWAVLRGFCGSEFDVNKATTDFVCFFNVNVLCVCPMGK